MGDQYYNTNQANRDNRSGYIQNGNSSISSGSGNLMRGFVGGSVYVWNGNYYVSTSSLLTINGSNIYQTVNTVNGNYNVSTGSLISGSYIGANINMWNGNYVSTSSLLTINGSNIYQSVNTWNGNYSVTTTPIFVSVSNIYENGNTVNENYNSSSRNFSRVTNNGRSVYSVNESGDSTNLIKSSNVGGNVYAVKGNDNGFQYTNLSSSPYSEEESGESLENERICQLNSNYPKESHTKKESEPDVYMVDPSFQRMQGDEEVVLTKLNSGINNEDTHNIISKYAWETSNVKKEPVPAAVKADAHGQGMQEDEKRVPTKLNPGWIHEDIRLHCWKRARESDNEKGLVPEAVKAGPSCQRIQEDENGVPIKLNPGWIHKDTRLPSWKHGGESNNEKKGLVPETVKADPSCQEMHKDEKGVPVNLNAGWIHDDTLLRSWKHARKSNNEKKKADASCQEMQENEEEVPAKKRRKEE